MINRVEFLSGVSTFSPMKRKDLKRMVSKAKCHVYHKGDVIIKEGENGRRLFIIEQGTVAVIKNMGDENERLLQTLGPGSIFGEMALIDDLVRSASVVAMEETQLLSLEHFDLRKEIERYPALGLELLKMFSVRVRTMANGKSHELGSILPICSHCKNIRQGNDSWIPIETYMEDKSGTRLSHGICPQCVKRHYPEFNLKDGPKN